MALEARRPEGPRRLPRTGTLLVAMLVLASAAAGAQNAAQNYGQSFGTVLLAAGQAERVWLGASYRMVKLCNDFESAGTVVVTIDAQPSATLGPGRCTEDYGNSVQMANGSGSAATITYRSIVNPFTPG
jgi:hypothetical protein